MLTTTILLLANQPHEAKILAKIGNEIRKLQPNIKTTLVFTDYYTFYFQKQFLNGFESSFPGDVITQEKNYKNWQRNENLNSVNQDYLNKWSETYCKFRSLEQLERTNQWIYGDENDRFLLKTSRKWKTKILFDTILWCEELVSINKPTAFVSLGNETLPTNILYEISRVNLIPFYSISHTRLQNFWILRDDFAYGISDSKMEAIKSKYSDEESMILAQQFIDERLKKGEAFYPAQSQSLSQTFIKNKNNLLQNFYLELKTFIKGTYWRIFVHSRERPYKVKRVEQNLIMVTLDQLRYIIIYHLRLVGFKFCGKTEVPQKKYFFWALHARPESSVIVLGNGEDEIDKLFETADQVPHDYYLVVKENPLMVGRRNFGFYKRIKKHKRIILVDAFVSSIELIKNSIGVIGISGTVLLEASFFDKPSCALGTPEFNGFLCERGSDKAGIFINNVLSNGYDSPRNRMKPYVAYVLSEAVQSDFSLGLENGNSVNRNDISYFANKILDLIF